MEGECAVCRLWERCCRRGVGAEVAEDGEGEGVVVAGIVKREIGSARGESGPQRHGCMSGTVAHRWDFHATYDF